MEAFLPYLIGLGGVLVPALLAKLGINIPVIVPNPTPTPSPAPWSPIPSPAPAPVPAPAPAPVAPHQAITGAIEWGWRARAKMIAITPADRDGIKTLIPLLAEIEIPAPAPAPAPQ